MHGCGGHHAKLNKLGEEIDAACSSMCVEAEETQRTEEG